MNQKYTDLVELVEFAKTNNIKSIKAMDMEIEFHPPVMSTPVFNINDLVSLDDKADKMPSDEELLYASCGFNPEVNAETKQ